MFIIGIGSLLKRWLLTILPYYFSNELSAEVDMEEIWKDVTGFEEYYQVSSLGRLKALRRTVPDARWGQRTFKERISTGSLDKKTGYLRFNFCKQGKVTTRPIHQVMLEEFIGPKPFIDYQGCHCDGNKLNNLPENLRWDSSQNNNLDKIHHGTIACMEKNGRAVLTKVQVLKIRKLFNLGTYSKSELGRMFKVTDVSIGNIVNRKLWRHI